MESPLETATDLFIENNLFCQVIFSSLLDV
jgi:hypothetical protein